MKLTVKKDLKNQNCEIEIALVDVDEVEAELFSDFGSPQINVGGVITDTVDGEDGEETVTLLTLGDSFTKITPEFILKRTFAKAQHGDKTVEIANAYVEVLIDRITTEILALKAKSDNFSGSSEIVL